MDARAAALIALLGLQPHPEGGYYREVFRSTSRVQPADERDARAALTTIYFLLPEETHSRWHRVRSDEVWHLVEGGPVELLVADARIDAVERVLLGAASRAAGPVHTVPANAWQAARPLGPFALCGCTVGPGFEFGDFAFMRDDEDAKARLRQVGPDLAALI
jgi:predicted cupin superfamily sugar epimerase